MSGAGGRSPLLAAVDVGTTGARAMAIDLDGRVVAEVRRGYPTRSPHPGWAEQDPRDWGDRALEALAGLGARSRVAPRIVGIGLTGQCPTIAPFDARGRPVGPGMIYRDNRAAAEADLMRRTPYLARARGSNLLARVKSSMEQAVTGTAVPGALGRPGDAVLVVAGHDTNLSNLSGMLGLTWKLPGYPRDDTPPGGALIFSVWQDQHAGHMTVRVRYVSQTPDQMYRGDHLSVAAPPAIEELRVPGCAGTVDCPWDRFSRVVSEASGSLVAR